MTAPWGEASPDRSRWSWRVGLRAGQRQAEREGAEQQQHGPAEADGRTPARPPPPVRRARRAPNSRIAMYGPTHGATRRFLAWSRTAAGASTSMAACTLSTPPRKIACGIHHHACHQKRLVTMSNTRRVSDFGSFRATASTGSPLSLPSTPHFWMVTRGVLLMRLVFHEPSSVLINSLSPSGTPHTGVGLGRPSLVNVVSSRYFARVDVLERGSSSFRRSVHRLQFDRDVLVHAAAQLGEEVERLADQAVALADRVVGGAVGRLVQDGGGGLDRLALGLAAAVALARWSPAGCCGCA